MATKQSVRARAPDRDDSPSVAHLIRDHASALLNALQLARMHARDDARLLDALELADRQAKALVALAGKLHVQN